jgi:hypothetical protein
MISILFSAGMFGSTIEYCIRRFAEEFETVETVIKSDGSMHLFEKEYHPTCLKDLVNLLENNAEIITPVYPNLDGSAVDVIKVVKNNSHNRSVIFVSAMTREQAELSRLFKFYKVDCCNYSGVKPLYEFSDAEEEKKYLIWNKKYTSIVDMQVWEKREMLSLELNLWLEELLSANSFTEESWLHISPIDLLNNFKETIIKIINYLGLTLDDTGLDAFANEWINKQQYVLNEFDLIKNIVESTVNQKFFRWEKLSIMSESLIQTKLFNLGYNLKCYGVNNFPNNSIDLANLLELA